MALRGFRESALDFGVGRGPRLPDFGAVRLPPPVQSSVGFTDLAKQIRERRSSAEKQELSARQTEARILGPVDPAFVSQAQAQFGGAAADPSERVARAYQIAGAYARTQDQAAAAAQEREQAEKNAEAADKVTARLSSNRAQDEAKRIELAAKYQTELSSFQRNKAAQEQESRTLFGLGDESGAIRAALKARGMRAPSAPTYRQPQYGDRGYIQGYEDVPLFGEQAPQTAPGQPPPAAPSVAGQSSPAGVPAAPGGLFEQIMAQRQANAESEAAAEAEKQATKERTTRNKSIQSILGGVRDLREKSLEDPDRAKTLRQDVESLLAEKWDPELGEPPAAEQWLGGTVRPEFRQMAAQADIADAQAAAPAPTGPPPTKAEQKKAMDQTIRFAEGQVGAVATQAFGALKQFDVPALMREMGRLNKQERGRGFQFAKRQLTNWQQAARGTALEGEAQQAAAMAEQFTDPQKLAAMAARFVPVAAAVGLTGGLGAAPALVAGAGMLAGGAGSALAQLIEGREVDPREVALDAALSGVPAGTLGRMAMRPGLSSVQKLALIAAENAMQGALEGGVTPIALEGRAPSAGEVVLGAGMGAALGTPIEAGMASLAARSGARAGVGDPGGSAALSRAAQGVDLPPTGDFVDPDVLGLTVVDTPPVAPSEADLPELDIPPAPGEESFIGPLPELQGLEGRLAQTEVAGGGLEGIEAALAAQEVPIRDAATGRPERPLTREEQMEVVLDQIEAGVRPNPYPGDVGADVTGPQNLRTPQEIEADLAEYAAAREAGTSIENFRGRQAAGQEADALMAELGQVPRGTSGLIPEADIPLFGNRQYPEPIGPPAPPPRLGGEDLATRALRVAAGLEAPQLLGPGGRPVGELVDPTGAPVRADRQRGAAPGTPQHFYRWLVENTQMNRRQWDAAIQDPGQAAETQLLLNEYNDSIREPGAARIPRDLPIGEWANRTFGDGTWEAAAGEFQRSGQTTEIDRLRAGHSAYLAGTLPEAVAGIDALPVAEGGLTRSLADRSAAAAAAIEGAGATPAQLADLQGQTRLLEQEQLQAGLMPPGRLRAGRTPVLAERLGSLSEAAARVQATEALASGRRRPSQRGPRLERELRPILRDFNTAVAEAAKTGPNQGNAIEAARAKLDEISAMVGQVEKLDPDGANALRDIRDQQRMALTAAEASAGPQASYAVSEGPLGDYRIAQQNGQWFVTSHLSGSRSQKTLSGSFKRIPFEGEKAVLGPFRTQEGAEAGAHELADAFTRAADRIEPGPRYMQDLRRTEGTMAGRFNRLIPESMRGFGTLRQYRQAGLSPRAATRAPGVEAPALSRSDIRSRRNLRERAALAEAEGALGRTEDVTAEDISARQAQQEEARATARAEAEARAAADDIDTFIPSSVEDLRNAAAISDNIKQFADFLGRPVTDPEVRRIWKDVKGKADARAGERGAIEADLLTAPARVAGRVAEFATTGPRTTLETLTKKAGATGEALVKGVQNFRDRLARLDGDWTGRIRKGMRSVRKENWPKIQQALEDPSVKLTPEEATGVGIIRKTLRDIAGKAGDVNRLVGQITNYFPRYMLEAPGLKDQASGLAKDWWGSNPKRKQAMKDLGATTPTDQKAIDYAASALLFREFARYGGIDPHLEIRRRGSERTYITDPRVLLDYAHSAARAIATGDVFDQALITPQQVQGPVRPGETLLPTTGTVTRRRLGKFEEMWSRIVREAQESGNLNERQLASIRQTLERELGFEQRAPLGSAEATLNAAQTIWASSKLGASFLTQPLVLQDVAGIMGAGNLARGISEFKANRQGATDRAVRAGSIEAPERMTRDMAMALREQGVELRRGGQQNWFEGVADKYRNAKWMKWMLSSDAGARVVSDSAARRLLPSVVADVKAGNKGTMKLLEDIGINPAQLTTLNADTIARLGKNQDSIRAADLEIVDRYARRMVEHTNQRVRAADLPAAWATGGPLVRFATLFMSYPYRQAKTVLRTIARNPKMLTRYMINGIPVGIVIGNGLQMLKSVIAGYGALGDEEKAQLPEEDRSFVQDAIRLLDNKPIRPDNERSAYLRLLQGAVRGMPKPFLAQWFEKIARGRAGAQDVTGLGQITGQMAQLMSALAGLQPMIEKDEESGEYRELPYWENALRSGVGAAGALAVPFVGSQLNREFGPSSSISGYSTVRPASSPGLVGRLRDLAAGETTLGQTAEGVLFGGESTLSERRITLKRKAELQEAKRKLDKLKIESGKKTGRPEKTQRKLEQDIRKTLREIRKMEEAS